MTYTQSMNEFDLDHAADVMNFNREVVNYCSTNEDFFIFEGGDAMYDGVAVDVQSPEDYADAAVEHYNAVSDACGDDELSASAEKQFRFVAAYYHEHGYFPHA